MLDDAVELVGMVDPFRDDEWFTVSVDRSELLSVSLEGTSSAWKELRDCESAVHNGGWLTLSGEITGRTLERIARAIRYRRPEGLLLDSTGGSPQEARRIGSIIRKEGIATKVEAHARCLSECTLILAAGRPRTVEAGARVGIVPAVITGGLGVFGSVQGATGDSASYFEQMGVDARRLAILATTSQPGDTRVLTSEELRRVRLADNPAPITESAVIPGRPPDPEVDNWWLLGGLFGVSVLGWSLMLLRRKS